MRVQCHSSSDMVLALFFSCLKRAGLKPGLHLVFPIHRLIVNKLGKFKFLLFRKNVYADGDL